ncbi:MAG TPA: hypothetical protein VLH19_05595 [Patescibacteria group bacterium]|nr:hypothetical protein [Patescibacteria group bacterium]
MSNSSNIERRVFSEIQQNTLLSDFLDRYLHSTDEASIFVQALVMFFENAEEADDGRYIQLRTEFAAQYPWVREKVREKEAFQLLCSAVSRVLRKNTA